MPLNLLGDFFSILKPSLFTSSSAILIICFIIWELPRTLKIMDEEYTKDLYPENSRIPDFFFLFWGLIGILYLFPLNNTDNVLAFLKTPGITSFYIVIMITIPFIVLMGYFKRFFERMHKHDSLTIFTVQSFMDLMHTLFFISVSILMVPILGYLIGPLK
ncbi:MAG: hypothetical protein ABID61_05660 [Candidatus Micrarchaeota archaeon]